MLLCTGATPSPPQHTVFTQEQLAALKYQIMAYKLISKNMPLPPNLQQAILASPTSDSSSVNPSHKSPSIESQTLIQSPVTQPDMISPAAPSSIPPPPPTPVTATPTESLAQLKRDSTTLKTSTPPHAVPPPTPVYNAYASPYNLMKKPISSFSHASRQQRLLIPSITASGMDPEALSQERERQIQARITFRQSQLESETKQDTLSDQENTMVKVKIKALIELQSLKLLEKQKKVKTAHKDKASNHH